MFLLSGARFLIPVTLHEWGVRMRSASKQVLSMVRRSAALAVCSLGVVGALSLSGVPQAHAEEADPRVTITGDIQIVDQGETADGGWVAYTGTGSMTIDDTVPAEDNDGEVSTRAVKTVSAGGGTWHYGSTVNGAGQKVCLSQYMHKRVAHGSTAEMAGSKDSAWQRAGTVAASSVAKYTTKTCIAHWRK